MLKPRGDVEISSSFYVLLLSWIGGMSTGSMNLYVAGCGSSRLGRCRVRRKLWLQVWYHICSYAGGGEGVVVYAGLVSLTSSSYPSPYSPYMLLCCGGGILYKTLLARKLSKPEDGRYRPKHTVFLFLINTIIRSCIYSCVFDWIYLTI